MALPQVTFRELNTLVAMTTFETPVSSPVVVEVWAKVVAYLDLPYWSSSSVGFVLLMPAGMEDDYWRGWFITYAGLDYYFYQFRVVDDAESFRKFVFVEGRSTTFTDGEATIDEYKTCISDAAADAAGVAVGSPYWTAVGHDRTGPGVLVKRLE